LTGSVVRDIVTLNIVVPAVQADQIIAFKRAPHSARGVVPGAETTPETEVHPDGMLGLINLDETTGQEVLERSMMTGLR
jgi:hypothetical protein